MHRVSVYNIILFTRFVRFVENGDEKPAYTYYIMPAALFERQLWCNIVYT